MSDHSESASLTHQGIRTPRAAALADIAFSVLLTAAFVVVRWALPGDPNNSGEWLTDGSRRDAFVLALNLLPFAGIAFLWFMGVLRDQRGVNEDRFLCHGVPRERAAVRRHGVHLRGGGRGSRVVVRRGSSPPAELWSFGRPRRAHPPGGVRTAHGCGVHDLDDHDRRPPGLIPRSLVVFGMATGMATGLALLVAAGAVPWIEIVFPLWVLVFSAHILIATMPESRRAP
jgi:hypothetical protein